jgi:hypothetical protein
MKRIDIPIGQGFKSLGYDTHPDTQVSGSSILELSKGKQIIPTSNSLSFSRIIFQGIP